MKNKSKPIKAVGHKSKRLNIPTAEQGGLVEGNVMTSHEKHRIVKNNKTEHFDPHLQWRNKKQIDSDGLVIPLHVQELIQPQSIITKIEKDANREHHQSTFFNTWGEGVGDKEKLEFYSHKQPWQNRLILGDSHLIMKSLSRKEGLNDKVQCIYVDPPYGIKFSSNWQPSTTKAAINRANETLPKEPEAIKVYRDTWADGLNSYLSYLHERLFVCHELLSPSGSIFVQIGIENVHKVRCILDEIFGVDNFVNQITFRTRPSLAKTKFPAVCNYLLWYAKNTNIMKYTDIYEKKSIGSGTGYTKLKNRDLRERSMDKEEKSGKISLDKDDRPFAKDKLVAMDVTESCMFEFEFRNKKYNNKTKSWATNEEGMRRLEKADRIIPTQDSLSYRRYFDDFPLKKIDNIWNEQRSARNQVYAVQTNEEVVQRCILMTTEPGDLVLDPTCGSGTTAQVAEEWGRRWIAIDTSRVAVALTRSRLIGSVFPYYVLKDSIAGVTLERKYCKSPPPLPGIVILMRI